MQKWEYKTIDGSKINDRVSNDNDKFLKEAYGIIPYLNYLGKQGWEVINFQYNLNYIIFYLKRPIE